MPRGIYKRTSEAKRNISLAALGLYTPKEVFCSTCGILITKESKMCRECFNATKKGADNGRTGKKHTEYSKNKISKSMEIDGRTPLSQAIRNLEEYRNWRTNIFTTDDFTCKECGKRGVVIHAHHNIPFHIIFEDFIRQYNQFSVVEDKDILIKIAINHKPFWEADGKTLCCDCHNNTKYIVRRGYKT